MAALGILRPAVVRIDHLEKRFGRLRVLGGIDLAIAPGRITALVGPNAAGKSTLIKSIVGLVKLERGSRISIDGEPINGDYRYRARLGYMPQAPHFPSHLTGAEVLRLVEDVRGRPADTDRDLIDLFDLAGSLDRRVGTLSGGTRQKLNAVLAFLFRPTLLVLDEPTAGLDPVASAALKDKVLAAPPAGTTVILTSHVLSEVEELADEIVFLQEGRITFQGPLGALRDRTGETRLERAVASLLRGVA